MARLGSVLGAILAELARARLVADKLTRQFVPEYQADPILASMSVPRVVVDEATLTLRFSVSDLVEAPMPSLDVAGIRDAWTRRAATRVVPRVLVRLGVPNDEQPTLVEAISGAAGTRAGVPPLRDIRSAIAGDASGTVASTASPLLEAWNALPASIRSRLRTKTAFRRELERELRDELSSFIDREKELALVQAALASEIQVTILTEELPDDPGLVQEFRITVRGQDLDVLLQQAGEST